MKKILISVLTLLLTATLFIFVTNTTAQVEEADAVVSIPDANLAAAIRDALGLPAGAPITTHAMLNLTRLDAPGRGITDLTGLEYAINLTWLHLGYAVVDGELFTNPISDLSALAALTQLTRLSLDYTAVSDVAPLADLTQLTNLNLYDTAVSDVAPLANLTQLRWLNLYKTAVSDVTPLANLTQLRWLGLYKTAVSDVAPLANLTQLTGLSLSYTAVSDVVPLANLTQLKTLRLNNTAVSDVAPLANLTQLKTLELSTTAVSDVAPLANLTQLTHLELDNCPLNAPAHQTHIPAIQANGTEVHFDPFKPIHLPREPGLVSLIYFRPSDRPVRPNVDAEIDGLIKEAQRFYADEMERHGYGRKTFQFETDAHGNAVVHHVNGKFTDEYYRDNRNWREETREQVHTPRGNITVWMLDTDGALSGACGIGGGFPHSGGTATIYCWKWAHLAHELGHAFGMHYHDFRDDAYIMSYGYDKELSPCFSAWLDVHPAFNPGQIRRGGDAQIEMLPATLAAPPNAIRLQFTVTAPAGTLYQARLIASPERRKRRDGSKFNTGGLVGCQRLQGNPTRSTVEFVTTALTPYTKEVELDVIGTDGSVSGESFPIDVSSLLPPAKPVSIPDPNLAAAVREELGLSSGEAITTHAMLRLDALEARNAGIKSLTGLEHAVNLRGLNLGGNGITDLSVLSHLTQLTSLRLGGETLSSADEISVFVSSLPPLKPVSLPDANLAAAVREALGLSSGEAITTHAMLRLDALEARNAGIKSLTGLEHAVNLRGLNLGGNGITDLSVLSHLTQLTSLRLGGETLSSADEISVFVSSLPPLKPVSLPDANLAAAVREALGLSSGEAITTHAMLRLDALEARNAGIKDLTGLEHAVNLKRLHLGGAHVSGEGYVNSNEGYVNSNAVTDWSPLAKLAKLPTLNLSSTPGLVDVSPLAILTQLTELSLYNTAVSDVAPLANLTQLTYLFLGDTAVSDVAPLANLTQLTELSLSNTAVSDVAPLANLTQLTYLFLGDTAVSDVAPLANLTQLTGLYLWYTSVSDVAPLANLTQLTQLELNGTAVSDVAPLVGLNLTGISWDSNSIGLSLTGCPLSYASIHTHIPALQAKGIEVRFDNVAHPALLKTSGDEQEGMLDAALPNPFVVEAMDEHGNPIVGKPVQFEILAGGGTLSAQTATTDARGRAQITLTLGSAAGVNRVKATAEGIESWVLFTAVVTEAAPQLAADVNGDGIVNILDLTAVSGQFGKAGKNNADVNGDGQVNIQDLVMVAGAFGQEAAAPSARAVSLARLTAADLEQWLSEARSASRPGGLSYRRGIVVLEQLLANLIPEETALLANYPNPFNPETWIPYQLATPAEVTVTIYAANGMVVRTLALGHRRAGDYASRPRAAYWDGRNALGERVASGVYFYTLQAGDFAATRKMLILK